MRDFSKTAEPSGKANHIADRVILATVKILSSGAEARNPAARAVA